MTCDDILEQALVMLRRRGHVSYRTLKVQFQLDDDLLALLRDESLRYASSPGTRRARCWSGRERSLLLPLVPHLHQTRHTHP